METISASEWFVSAKQRDECKGEREGSALQSLSLPFTLEGGQPNNTHLHTPYPTFASFSHSGAILNEAHKEEHECKRAYTHTHKSMLHLVMDAAC